MNKRLRALAAALALLLVGSLCLLAFGVRAAAQTAPSPYAIMVNRKMNTVTIYTRDEDGNYTVPFKAMICSTGRAGHVTPLGSYETTDVKKEWCLMLDGTYGQYSTQFSGHYLFHSICYTAPDPSALIASEYNLLGSVASLGCVRLQTVDAKWIYDNCPAGTSVTVYESDDPGPLGKPDRLVDEIPEDSGWDPTDPRPENPWTQVPVESVTLSAETASLSAGSALSLHAKCLPEDAGIQSVVWRSSDPAVASVDHGRVVGLSAGTAVITASCGAVSASCEVTVSGTLLPFTDLVPGAWYYDDMRFACAQGILNGTGKMRMDPNGEVTWPAALQIIYNLAGKPAAKPADERWFGAALGWAEETGLLEKLEFRAGAPISREDMVTLLFRWMQLSKKTAFSASDRAGAFSDGSSVSAYAREAVGWAAEAGILKGDEKGRLNPGASLTRAQAAAIVRRCLGAA